MSETAGRGRRRRARAPESTRRAILDAALALFAEKGYHETTVPDIVKAADVGHGTFYEYFGNRRDVLLELTREAGVRAADRPHVAPATLAERIRLEIVWYLTDHVNNVELSKIWAEAATFDAEIAAARMAHRRERLARVRRGVEAAAPAGVDAEIAASALVAMLEEFARRWFIEGEGPAITPGEVVRAAQTVANLWVRAIGAEEASSGRSRPRAAAR